MGHFVPVNFPEQIVAVLARGRGMGLKVIAAANEPPGCPRMPQDERSGGAWCDWTYHIGKALEPIREQELWRQLEGCRNWGHYCQLGRVSYQKSQANTFIRAARIRPLLVDISDVKVDGNPATWNLNTVEQLCRLPLDSDIKRASKKIATRVKHGDRQMRKFFAFAE